MFEENDGGWKTMPRFFSLAHGVLRIFGLCYFEGDSEIALVAVTSNPSALQFLRFTLAQIQRNLLLHQFVAASTLQIWLRFAAQKLQNTKKIVLAAVSKEPLGCRILPAALSCVNCYMLSCIIKNARMALPYDLPPAPWRHCLKWFIKKLYESSDLCNTPNKHQEPPSAEKADREVVAAPWWQKISVDTKLPY